MSDLVRKVEGISFEDVLDIAEKRGIHYYIHKHPAPTRTRYEVRYFRDSTICILPEYKDELFSLTANQGEGHIVNAKTFTLKAFYEILAGFDLSILDGPVYFRRGLLMERVIITAERDRLTTLYHK